MSLPGERKPKTYAGVLGASFAAVIAVIASLKRTPSPVLYVVTVDGKHYTALVPEGWTQEQIEAHVRAAIAEREEDQA